MFILNVLHFYKVYIIYDRSQRRFDIMRYIGDQIRFHTLILGVFIHRAVQSVTDIVDGVRHLFVCLIKAFGIDLELEVSLCNLIYPFQEPRLLDGIAQLIDKSAQHNAHHAD